MFTTPEGWALILIGNAIGLGFGALVLGLSVVSLPMLVDCDVSAAEAVSTSWRAAHANPGVMFRWGLTVAALLVLGSIPLFVGLAARAAVARLLDLAPVHEAGRPQRDQVRRREAEP